MSDGFIKLSDIMLFSRGKNLIFVNLCHLQKNTDYMHIYTQISYTTTYSHSPSQLHSQTSIHISIHILKHDLTFTNTLQQVFDINI
jgi:hypothetical protein